MIRTVLKKILYGFYLIIAVLVLAEIVFRIYDPFRFSVKGNVIMLESNLHQKSINDSIPGIEREIVINRNELGFRGEHKPVFLQDYLSIVAIGGSTTECKYISDNKTWVDVMALRLSQNYNKVWVNNAGLSGHTTFGHQVLLIDHIVSIRPKVALFLIGANDMALKDTSIWDKNSFINHYSSIKNFLLKKTVTGNIVINLWRARKAAVNNLTDKFYDLKKAKGNEVKYDSVYEKSELMKQEEFLPAFRKRVNQLVDTCEKYKIIPVLITQPCMLGKGIDAVSGADLALVPATKNANGELFNQMLEMYNDVTRSVGRNRNVVVIDLAEKLEKGGGYFYDILHFNLEGNRRVAEIITISMDSLLKVQFKTYLKKP